MPAITGRAHDLGVAVLKRERARRRAVDAHLFLGAFDAVILTLPVLRIGNTLGNQEQGEAVQPARAGHRPGEQHADFTVAAGDKLLAAIDPPRSIGLPRGSRANVADVRTSL